MHHSMYQISGARVGYASTRNAPYYVLENWGLVGDVRVYIRHPNLYQIYRHHNISYVSAHLGLTGDVQVYAIHHDVNRNIGGSSGRLTLTQDTVIRTVGARRDCCMQNTT